MENITRLDWKQGSYLNRFKYTEYIEFFDYIIMINCKSKYYIELIDEELCIILFYVNDFKKNKSKLNIYV